MEIIVLGAGPAGMIAAGIAAQNGHKVTLVDKNEKVGKKLYITGKGRCNLTNASDEQTLINNIVSNPPFMYSGFYAFNSSKTIEFFEKLGVNLKIERGNRVFPLSDKSTDIIDALKSFCISNKVNIYLNTQIDDIINKDNKFIVKSKNKSFNADKLIIASGGLSYPSTGSTGDGFAFAKKLGHSVINPTPSLVPLNVKEEFIKDLQGLSLRNIEIKIFDNKKIIYKEFGELLFTHFGVSGPVILSASAFIADKNYTLSIDLKPALTDKQLDERLIREINNNINKDYKNIMSTMLPQKMIDVFISMSNIMPNKKVNEITKIERLAIVNLLKNFSFTINSKRSFNEAIITKGGINTKEIDPTTMESKIMKNLYFAGEIIDVDALTGGFNLQIAFSTGFLAGNSI